MGPYQHAIQKHAKKAIGEVLDPANGISLQTCNGLLFWVPRDSVSFEITTEADPWVTGTYKVEVSRGGAFVVRWFATHEEWGF